VLRISAEIIKSGLVPGSIGFLVAGVVVGVLFLFVRRLERLARWWLMALSVLYIVLAIPVVSWSLERGRTSEYRPIEKPGDAAGASAVVVLGNGIVSYQYDGLAVESLTRRTAYNAIEGARLYRLLHPDLVIASGGLANPERLLRNEGEAVRDALVALGVPRDVIATETRSTNTAEQAAFVTPLLKGYTRFALVTTPIHMPRAMALFRSRGLHPVAAPSHIAYGGELRDSPARFLPSSNSLRASELSLYEYLGLAYARTRGWLNPPPDAPQ